MRRVWVCAYLRQVRCDSRGIKNQFAQSSLDILQAVIASLDGKRE